MNDTLYVRIFDRTHGATLGECEQWAEEVRLKDVHIANLEEEIAALKRENEAFRDWLGEDGLVEMAVVHEVDDLLARKETPCP